ncbi:MAG: AAA family ATPase [Parvibaculum sp.]|jgi:hypothetical protein
MAGREEEAALVALLKQPATYGLPPETVIEHIETHVSHVFLTPDHAYKLKKRVDLGFLDFRALEARHRAVEDELRLNRRTAPDIYLGAVPVTRHGADLAMGRGSGTVIDWLVWMRRFPAEGLFSRLAGSGQLTHRHIEPLAASIAAFHLKAEICSQGGGAAGFTDIILGNDRGLTRASAVQFGPVQRRQLREMSLSRMAALSACLEERRRQGYQRHCHGDLHLGNITLIDGVPVIFDCIEFSTALSVMDVLYDLAFLLADLAFRARRHPYLDGFANLALNVYLDHLPEADFLPMLDGLVLLDLFIATRAAVRAKVTAPMARSEPEIRHSRDYLAFACSVLQTHKPELVAIGGLSGTGKSTLAKRLAPKMTGCIGGVHLRSDIIRKRLLGVQPLDRLPESAYAPDVTARVYDEMFAAVDRALKAGMSVVVDAVFARETERQALEHIAAERGTSFRGVWLEAPQDLLEARIVARNMQGNDPSDADIGILHRQLTYDLGVMTWSRLDASQPGETLLQRMLALGDAIK